MFKILRRNEFILGALLLIIAGAFSSGYFEGKRVAQTPANLIGIQGKPGAVDFTPFWQAWAMLDDRFVGSTTPDDQNKVWGAIQGLTSSYGDPYTVFMPPEEAKSFGEAVSGNFEGVGMEIGIRDNILTVVAPIKGSPAAKAGIRAGDKIIKINATSTEGMSIDTAVKFIKGPRGTSVQLSIYRVGAKQPIVLNVTRDVVDIPTIETDKRKDGVFVIRLFSFNATSPGLFRNALREFAESGQHLLVVDLRNNPGGYLEAAVDMASWFLPVGKVVVREDFGHAQEENVYRSKGYDVFNDSLKMVVLVNGGSASASEIFAGALRDQGKAQLVGETTFGKGSVQELFPLTSKSTLKITIARWLTPNGISISKAGLKPDVEVKLTEEDLRAGKDPQIEKAAQVLLGTAKNLTTN